MAKIGFFSLGCPKNVVDAEEMLGEAEKAGHQIESDPMRADVLIVNTCGFIQSAKEESIDAVLDAIRYKTDGACRSVIVSGCLAQRYGKELARELPEADGFVGLGRSGEIGEVISRTLAGKRVVGTGKRTGWWMESRSRVLSTPPWTAYLRIGDGCDNRCSYCIIPGIRGRFRSRPERHILAEARGLAERGVKEINLVAQDITRYGLDRDGKLGLPSLLDRLSGIEGIRWIRLLYCYPTRITAELIDTIAGNDKVCKYVDAPLQHCSERILRAMHRQGSKSEYLDLIARLRQVCPSIVLRTTLIVGFPGETEDDFEELMDFVREVRFDRLGAFAYSREEGTPAAELPCQVGRRIANGRLRRLMELQQDISLQKNQELVGSRLEVLVERIEGDVAVGRSYRDAPEIDGVVYVEGARVTPGEFISAQIAKATHYDLTAACDCGRADYTRRDKSPEVIV